MDKMFNDSSPSETAPVSGFEGCEKRLMISFLPTADLRTISRAVIDTMLTEAKCTIISQRCSGTYDAYVLSESSLFVFAHRVILKTCGTTTLLNSLPTLLKAAKEIGAEPARVQFSRYDFLFPEKQPYPHNGFHSEVEYLKTCFPSGRAYVLGPMFTPATPLDGDAVPGETPRWHLFLADCVPADGGAAPERTFEMVMFDMDRDVMRQFYRPPEDPEHKVEDGFVYPNSGEEATSVSGIDAIVPGSEIDSFLFNPCGYSCNGLKDDIYFTIHITPEPQCSFVSFEANVDMESYTSLIQRLIDTFKPGSFCTSVFTQGADPSAVDSRPVPMDANYDGYVTESSLSCLLDGNYTVHTGQFNGIKPPNCPSHPARANKLGCESKTQGKTLVITADGASNGEVYVDGAAVPGDIAASKALQMRSEFVPFPAPYEHDDRRVEADDLDYDINER